MYIKRKNTLYEGCLLLNNFYHTLLLLVIPQLIKLIKILKNGCSQYNVRNMIDPH